MRYSSTLYSAPSRQSGGLWRVPLLSIITGLIVKGADLLLARGLNADETYFSLTGTSFSLWILFAVSVILFIVGGLIFLRGMSKGAVFKSAAIVVVYSIIVLAIETFIPSWGFMRHFYIPWEMYYTLSKLLMHFTGIVSYWVLIPSILLPFLYILFGRGRRRDKIFF